MNKKVLEYCFWWPIKTLDTHEADTPPVMQIARNIYATLVSEHILGEPEGILVKSWIVSDQGREWRFKLKENLRFDDGSLITPEIVLMSFKRILWLTREEGLVLNSLLPEVQKWKSMREDSRCICIENVNELVFRFIKEPLSLFETISQPIYGIVHPKCFDSNGIWKKPFVSSASGQYSISEVNDRYIQIKNRYIFRNVTNAPDEVRISWPYKEGDTVLSLLSERKIDLTVEHSFAIGKERFDELLQEGIQIVEEPPLRMHFVHLNYKREPFSKKNLREMFRDQFLNLISIDPEYLSAGSEVDPSFIPKGGIGYVKFNLLDNPINIKINFKKKIEILFYPFSSDFKIQKSIERIILNVIENLGLDANVVHYSERSKAFDRMRRDDFDLIVRGSGILVHNPFADLRMMFMSNLGAKIPDPSNKIKDLILQPEDEPCKQQREKLVTQINENIFEEAAIITFAHSSVLYLMNKSFDFSNYNLFADPIEFRAIGWKNKN